MAHRVELPNTCVVITSASVSLNMLRNASGYKELHEYIPEEELVRYSCDADALFGLLDTAFTTEDDSPTAIEYDTQEKIFEQAMQWREEFIDEVKPQLDIASVNTLNIVANTAFHLIRGSRVVCTIFDDSC